MQLAPPDYERVFLCALLYMNIQEARLIVSHSANTPTLGRG
jgi:hypothetical protein